MPIPKDDRVYLWDMLNAARAMVDFMRERSLADYEVDPLKWTDCGKVISLGYEGHSVLGDRYWCKGCTAKKMRARR